MNTRATRPNRRMPVPLVQMLFPRRSAGTDLGPVLGRLRRAPGKELVDQCVHLADLGVSEMAP